MTRGRGELGVQLTVFTAPMCLACHELMEYLDQQGIEYNAIDISSNGGAQSFIRMRQGGQGIVPMLWDGDSARALVGFSPARVDRFIKEV